MACLDLPLDLQGKTCYNTSAFNAISAGREAAMPRERTKRNRILADLLLALGLAVAALLCLLLLRHHAREGSAVRVSAAGEVYGTYSLSQDQRLHIVTPDGEGTLVIAGGQAWMEDASCPDKLCEQQGKIHQSGQMVVCAPSRIVFEILSGESDVDFVVH